jgi:hypothetical protein
MLADSALVAVVVTVSFAGIEAVEPFAVRVPGLKLHVAICGKPEQEKLTVPLYPFCGRSVTVTVPVWPCFTVSIFVLEHFLS